jgi:hypothetical protein
MSSSLPHSSICSCRSLRSDAFERACSRCRSRAAWPAHAPRREPEVFIDLLQLALELLLDAKQLQPVGALRVDGAKQLDLRAQLLALVREVQRLLPLLRQQAVTAVGARLVEGRHVRGVLEHLLRDLLGQGELLPAHLVDEFLRLRFGQLVADRLLLRGRQLHLRVLQVDLELDRRLLDVVEFAAGARLRRSASAMRSSMHLEQRAIRVLLLLDQRSVSAGPCGRAHLHQSGVDASSPSAGRRVQFEVGRAQLRDVGRHLVDVDVQHAAHRRGRVQRVLQVGLQVAQFLAQRIAFPVEELVSELVERAFQALLAECSQHGVERRQQVADQRARSVFAVFLQRRELVDELLGLQGLLGRDLGVELLRLRQVVQERRDFTQALSKEVLNDARLVAVDCVLLQCDRRLLQCFCGVELLELLRRETDALERQLRLRVRLRVQQYLVELNERAGPAFPCMAITNRHVFKRAQVLDRRAGGISQIV